MQFKGIIPPLVTPLLDRDTLDYAGLERLIEHVLAGGVHSLFILGTTGEAPSLSYRLRGELIKKVCRIVNGRVPVLAGITDTAFVESINIAHVAADAGASAVVLTTPYYFPAGQNELKEYIRNIVSRLPLPVMLYNMPAMTKIVFEIDTLQELADLERILGVKDSSGDIDYFANLIKLRERRPDWTFFMGPEHMLVEALGLGADGGVSGGANVFPRLFVQTYEAVMAGEQERTKILHEQIESFQRIYTIGKYPSRFIKGTKCALSILGICDDFMGEPFHRFRTPERERVTAIVQECAAKLKVLKADGA